MSDTPTRQTASQRSLAASCGYSLVEILITLAIAGVVVAVGARYHAQSSASQTHLDNAGSSLAIRDNLKMSADCAQTYADNGISPATCAPTGQVINLEMKSGAVLVSATDTPDGATKISSWTVRATCFGIGASDPGIHIDIARPDPAAANPLSATSFSNDPATGAALSYRGLFPQHAQLCSKDFHAVASSACPPATAGAGGIQPISLHQDNPAQCSTPLGSMTTTHVFYNDLGKRLCRYYGPLVHGSDSCVKPGPASWYFKTSAANNMKGHHYGNLLNCPSGWVAVGGGGSCDAISAAGNNSGGFVAVNVYNGAYERFECDGIYVTGVQHQAIDQAVYVDCQEP